MTEEDCIIEVEGDISAAESERWRRQSIYKIPITITSQDAKAYKPQTVSIGPIHHGKEHYLEAMETHKVRAQRRFLCRLGKPIEFLLRELCPIVHDLRDAYGQLDDAKWRNDDKAFLELMIRDGCFILEILRATTGQFNEDSNEGYPENDPIFSKHGKLNIVPYLKRDMLMLENQIPLVVLQKLHSISPIEEGSKALTRRILKFFSQTVLFHQCLDELGKCPHILDLNRKNLIFLNNPKKRNTLWHRLTTTMHNLYLRFHRLSSDDPSKDIIPSATDLKDAGITIKKSETESLQDITFDDQVMFGLFGAVLKLPPILVDDAFKSSYLNMMAYEHFRVGAGNEVTSYIFFMDNIIDSEQDVRLLNKGGVIRNALGSREAVAKLFNSLSADSPLDPESRLGKVHEQVSGYCKRHRHQWIGYCTQHYFMNPLVAVTVVAAILIFLLTALQTTYAVLGYHNPSSK